MKGTYLKSKNKKALMLVAMDPVRFGFGALKPNQIEPNPLHKTKAKPNGL